MSNNHYGMATESRTATNDSTDPPSIDSRAWTVVKAAVVAELIGGLMMFAGLWLGTVMFALITVLVSLGVTYAITHQLLTEVQEMIDAST